MLSLVGRYILSAALVLVSRDAFRQGFNEFGDTEPGSPLFGALQLIIGVSAAAGALGVFKRARWAAGAIGGWGIATVALLLSQPLFDTMDTEALKGIWIGAGAVGAAAAGTAWFARRLAKQSAASHPSVQPVQQAQASVAPQSDAGRPADPLLPAVPITQASRAEPSTRQVVPLPNPGTAMQE